MNDESKWSCGLCGWTGNEDELVRHPSGPFGCPSCYQTEGLSAVKTDPSESLMTLDTMISVLRSYYRETPPYMELLGHGRAAGGYLHIVVDDGNLEDSHIEYCIGDAREHGDRHAVLIGEELLSWNMEEREELYDRYKEYGYF